MNYAKIYPRLKQFLAKDTRLPYETIRANLPLGGHPLGYDAAGRRALARPLNRVFSDPPIKRLLTSDQTQRATTVRSLARLILEAYQ